MKTCLRLLAAYLIIVFSGSVYAAPLIAIIRDNHGQGWRLYTIGEKLKKGEKLFILSSEDGKKVICCATITSVPLLNAKDDPFISDAEEEGSAEQQIAYDVSVPDKAFSGVNGIALAVRAKSVTVDGKAFMVTDIDGESYKANSCIGSEGINVYLYRKTPRQPLKHYYGSLGYDISDGDCDQLN